MTVAHALASLVVFAVSSSPPAQLVAPLPPRYAVSIDGASFGNFADVAISQSPTATFLADTADRSGRSKVEMVTLKRGFVDGSQFYAWMHSKIDKTVVIVGSGPNGQKVIYHLKNCVPQRYSGPTLSAKSNEVAMEELVLSAESISISYPTP